MPGRAAAVVVVLLIAAAAAADWCPNGDDGGLAYSTNSFVLASGGDVDLLADRSVYWLHVPKAGTSMFNMLFHRCYPDGANMSLAKGHMAVSFTRKRIPQLRLHSECEVVVRVHRPYAAALGSEGGCPFWVAMLREPRQRLRSAFMSGGHCYGLGGSEAKAVHAIATLPEFARHASVQGCQTRMVSGVGACASKKRPASERMARQAVDVLRNRFAFIGITDRWDESVCLFYAMYGGSAAASDFLNQRPSPPARLVTDADMAAIADADPNDRLVFDFARRWFEEQLAVHRAAVDRCLRTVAGQPSDEQSLPSALLLGPLFDGDDESSDDDDDEMTNHLADLLERVAEEHTVHGQLQDKLHSDKLQADNDEQHMQQLHSMLHNDKLQADKEEQHVHQLYGKLHNDADNEEHMHDKLDQVEQHLHSHIDEHDKLD